DGEALGVGACAQPGDELGAIAVVGLASAVPAHPQPAAVGTAGGAGGSLPAGAGAGARSVTHAPRSGAARRLVAGERLAADRAALYEPVVAAERRHGPGAA